SAAAVAVSVCPAHAVIRLLTGEVLAAVLIGVAGGRRGVAVASFRRHGLAAAVVGVAILGGSAAVGPHILLAHSAFTAVGVFFADFGFGKGEAAQGQRGKTDR